MLPLWAMVLSGSVTLPPPRSVVRSMPSVATKSSEDRTAESWSSPSLTEALERTGLPSPTTALGRAGPAPYLESTLELTLQVSGFCGHERRPCSLAHMPCGGTGEENMPRPFATLSRPENRPRDHKNRRAVLVLHQLQKSGGQAVATFYFYFNK